MNGTLIWYYYICKREVWLIAHGIEANQQNELLELGKFYHEHFYAKKRKEIVIDNTIVLDLLPSKKIIAEVKKSSKFLKSAKMQLLFYLWYMKQKGVELKGELLIPAERKRFEVVLSKDMEIELLKTMDEIEKIIHMPQPPKVEKIAYCKHCAYKELCWS